MDTKNNISKVVCFSILLFSLTGCPETNVDPIYSFNLFFNVFPEKKSYHIQDTIWLKTKFSDLIVDINLNQRIDFHDAKFRIDFVMNELVKDNFTGLEFTQATNNFSFYMKRGKFQIVEELVYLEPEYLNNIYTIEIGIIPLKRGNFFIEGVADIAFRMDGSKKINAYTLPDFQVTDKNIDIITDLSINLKDYISNANKTGLGVFVFSCN